MLVKDCMTRHPILISPDAKATEAQHLMAENHIRHLPVVGDGKRLQGLVTQRSFALDSDKVGSLNMWDITRYLSNLTVKNVMITAENILTIAPDRTVERAARILEEHKIGCLPVVENDVVIGILSQVDLLHSYQEMLGLPVEGVRVIMRMPDNKKGEFAKLTAFVAKQGWGIMGIGSYPAPRAPGYWDVVLKIPDVLLEQVQAALSQVEGQEIVDIRGVV